MNIAKIANSVKQKFLNNFTKKHYAIVLLLVCTIIVLNLCVIVVLQVNKGLKDNQNSELITQNMMSYFDMEFRDIDYIVKTVSDICLKTFNNKAVPSDYERYVVVNELDKQMLGKQCIEEIAVISKYSASIITSMGTFDKKEYFDYHLYSKSYSSVYWENLNSGIAMPLVLPKTQFTNRTNHPNEVLMDLIPVVWSLSEGGHNIIVFINAEEILQKTGAKEANDFIETDVYNERDVFLFSSTENFHVKNESISTRSSYKLKSQYNNFTYVYRINKKLQIYDYIALGIFIMTIIIGVVLSKILSKKLLSPIVNIAKLADIEVSNIQIEDYMQKVKNILVEHASFVRNQQSNNKDLINTISLKMITDEKFYRRNKQYVINELGNSGYMPYYYFLYILTDRYVDIQVLDELDAVSSFHVGKYSIVMLIGDNEEQTTETVSKKLTNDLKKVLSLQNCNWVGAISQSFSDFSDAASVYLKVCSLVQYRGIKDNSLIISEKDIVMGKSYALTSTVIDEITLSIYAGNKIAIKSFISSFIHEIYNENISFVKLKSLVQTLMCIFSNLITLETKKAASIYEMEQIVNMMLESDRFVTIDSIKQSMLNYVSLALAESQEKETRLERKDVIKYIHDYYDTDIYLEKMAQEFNTTPKYFSNYFKREFKIGFIKYLTQVRIAQAKKMLTNTNLSLDEISIKVGYKNTATFISAFKTVTGTTPGKFRSMNEEQ